MLKNNFLHYLIWRNWRITI